MPGVKIIGSKIRSVTRIKQLEPSNYMEPARFRKIRENPMKQNSCSNACMKVGVRHRTDARDEHHTGHIVPPGVPFRGSCQSRSVCCADQQEPRNLAILSRSRILCLRGRDPSRNRHICRYLFHGNRDIFR